MKIHKQKIKLISFLLLDTVNRCYELNQHTHKKTIHSYVNEEVFTNKMQEKRITQSMETQRIMNKQ